jgi:hypothetical protein
MGEHRKGGNDIAFFQGKSRGNEEKHKEYRKPEPFLQVVHRGSSFPYGFGDYNQRERVLFVGRGRGSGA